LGKPLPNKAWIEIVQIESGHIRPNFARQQASRFSWLARRKPSLEPLQIHKDSFVRGDYPRAATWLTTVDHWLQTDCVANVAICAMTHIQKRGQIRDRTPLKTRWRFAHVRWKSREGPLDGFSGFSLDFTGRYDQTPGKGVVYAASAGHRNSFGGRMRKQTHPVRMRSL
jgi:hypothetical protein